MSFAVFDVSGINIDSFHFFIDMDADSRDGCAFSILGWVSAADRIRPKGRAENS